MENCTINSFGSASHLCCMLMLPESETVTICVLKFGEELLMDVQVSALGAIVGLIVAIFLIFKISPLDIR